MGGREGGECETYYTHQRERDKGMYEGLLWDLRGSLGDCALEFEVLLLCGMAYCSSKVFVHLFLHYIWFVWGVETMARFVIRRL